MDWTEPPWVIVDVTFWLIDKNYKWLSVSLCFADCGHRWKRTYRCGRVSEHQPSRDLRCRGRLWQSSSHTWYEAARIDNLTDVAWKPDRPVNTPARSVWRFEVWRCWSLMFNIWTSGYTMWKRLLSYFNMFICTFTRRFWPRTSNLV